MSVVAGDLRGAIAAGRQALAVFERHGNLWWACRTLWGLSMAFNAIGDWNRSLECCTQALSHGENLRDLRLRVVGRFRTGSTHILRGDPHTGLKYCEEALALSSSVPFDTAMIKAVRALGLVKIGNVASGIADMEEAMAWFERSKLRYTRSFVALWLAETCLRHGDHRRARALVDEVLAISRAIGYRHLEGVATRLLGELLIETEPAAAAEHVTSALVILGEVGARNDVAKTLVARAALRRASGAIHDARGLLETALKMFDEQGTLDELARTRASLAADPRDAR